jgi:hypothetical protein
VLYSPSVRRSQAERDLLWCVHHRGGASRAGDRDQDQSARDGAYRGLGGDCAPRVAVPRARQAENFPSGTMEPEHVIRWRTLPMSARLRAISGQLEWTFLSFIPSPRGRMEREEGFTGSADLTHLYSAGAKTLLRLPARGC